MLPAPATRAVICSAAPLPYPADVGAPRQTGPRRLIASLPAAGATQAGLRRPGALKITASCGREPVAPVTLTAITGPFPPGRWQCARQSLPHPSRHTPHSAPLFSLAGSQPTHPTCSPPPSQGAARLRCIPHLSGYTHGATASRHSGHEDSDDTHAHHVRAALRAFMVLSRPARS